MGGARRGWLGPLDCHPPSRSADTADQPRLGAAAMVLAEGVELYQRAPAGP